MLSQKHFSLACLGTSQPKPAASSSTALMRGAALSQGGVPAVRSLLYMQRRGAHCLAVRSDNSKRGGTREPTDALANREQGPGVVGSLRTSLESVQRVVVAAGAAVLLTLPSAMLPALDDNASVLSYFAVPAAYAHGHGGSGGQVMAVSADSPTNKYECVPFAPGERIHHYKSLGGFSHKIVTRSAEAQRLFDIGMLHAYAYNQPEALASFREGLKADPRAPMLHWGVAYASAPFMNKPAIAPFTDPTAPYPSFTPQELARGREALQQALQVLDELDRQPPWGADKALLAHDRKYVEAMYRMFQSSAPYGPEWDAAGLEYAKAMEAVAAQYPKDADAAALCAEGYANLTPWDFYRPAPLTATGAATKQFGDPSQGSAQSDFVGVPGLQPAAYIPTQYTERALELLGTSMRRSSGAHPLAAHLLIHLTESSNPGRGPNHAGRAEAAADVLGTGRYPFGHLTHMAGHTYLRIGRWADAVRTNDKAVKTDIEDAKRCMMPYGPEHDSAMALYAAMQGGDADASADWAERMTHYPEVFGPKYETDGREPVFPLLAAARFGDFKAILSTPEEKVLVGSTWGVPLPVHQEAFSRAMWHYTRALALAAQAESLPKVALDEVQAKIKAELDMTPQAQPQLLFTAASPAHSMAAPSLLAPAGLPSHSGGMAMAEVSGSSASGRMMFVADGAVVSDALAPAPAPVLPAPESVLVPEPKPVELVTPPEAVAKVIAEVEALRLLEESTPPDGLTRPGSGLGVWSPGFHHLMTLARLEAEARVATLQGQWSHAEELMEQAYQREPLAGYAEPPRQYRPIAQCLGWVLLQEGKLEEAARVYVKDLAEYPDNPWSLTGLVDILDTPVDNGVAALRAAGVDPSTLRERLAAAVKAGNGSGGPSRVRSSCSEFSEPFNG